MATKKKVVKKVVPKVEKKIEKKVEKADKPKKQDEFRVVLTVGTEVFEQSGNTIKEALNKFGHIIITGQVSVKVIQGKKEWETWYKAFNLKFLLNEDSIHQQVFEDNALTMLNAL